MNIKQLPWGKISKVATPVVLAGALITTVALTSADAAALYTGANIKDGSLYAADMNPVLVQQFMNVPYNNVGTPQLKTSAVTEDKLAPAVRTLLHAIGSGAQGPAGPAGPAGAVGPVGPAGPKGDSALVSVSAMSSLTNRPDSGTHGTWATDTLTRNISITRQHATNSSNCGPTATTCWFYTGSIADNGTGVTVAGANSPEAGTAIAGVVNVTISGASKIEFYASSDAPNPALVDATVNGSAHPTAQWAAMFFPAGTKVTDSDLLDWAWTYSAPATCEQWVNAKAGNTGDITGINGC